MAGGRTLVVLDSPNFTRLAMYRKGMTVMNVFGTIMISLSILQFFLLAHYTLQPQIVSLIFGVVSLGGGYIVGQKYQKLKEIEYRLQEQRRQRNSTISQPNQGSPQPHQGYPQPNQGYPQLNQGFQQPSPGFLQHSEGIPFVYNIWISSTNQHYHEQPPPNSVPPSESKISKLPSKSEKIDTSITNKL